MQSVVKQSGYVRSGREGDPARPRLLELLRLKGKEAHLNHLHTTSLRGLIVVNWQGENQLAGRCSCKADA